MSISHLHLFRPPTYAELKARHDEVVIEDLHNRHAAINGWMDCHGYSDETRIENEFGIEYSDHLKTYLGNFAAKTQASRKSILNRYQAIYFELLDSGKLPIGFHECLKVLIVPFETDLGKLAKATDIAIGNLKAWLSGIIPAFSSEEALGRLERQFGVPKGTLINRLPHLRLGKREYRTGKTKYGRRIQELQGLPFKLEFSLWPPKTQEQWLALVKHKTATFLPRGERRNKKWNIDKRGRCISAEARLGWTEDYFGFLVLGQMEENPKLRGKGMAVEDIDLALLSDTDLANDFLEFLKVRTGVYTEFCRVYLDFVHSLCRMEFGWLTQQPIMASHRLIASKLPNHTLVHRKRIELTTIEDRWAEWLAQTSAWIRSNRKSLREKIEKGRSHEPIDAYLDGDHPMDILFSLADTMEKHLPVLAHQVKAFALAYRDLFLVRFLTANPLRIKMFSIMTYRADNTGNLRQRKDGSWWLWFAKGDFKNFAGAAKEEYLVPLAASLRTYIEAYIRIHRDVLAGAHTCDYLFRPDCRAGKNPNRPMSEDTLSDVIRHATQHFITECAGFGPHSFRHLIATDIIKSDPANGYTRAAAALHDELETVKENYVKLKTSDHMAHWNSYHEDKLGRAAAGYADPEISGALEILREASARGIVSVPALIVELEKNRTKSSFFGLR